MEIDISLPHNLYCYVGIYSNGRTAFRMEFVQLHLQKNRNKNINTKLINKEINNFVMFY